MSLAIHSHKPGCTVYRISAGWYRIVTNGSAYECERYVHELGPVRPAVWDLFAVTEDGRSWIQDYPTLRDAIASLGTDELR